MSLLIQPQMALPAVGGVMEGQVIDAITKEGIPRASITIVDGNEGQYLGDGVAAGQEGYFLINSSRLRNNWVKVSSVGYVSRFYEVDKLLYNNLFELTPEYQDLTAVVVTPQSNKQDNTWYWLLGGVGLLFLLNRKKRKG